MVYILYTLDSIQNGLPRGVQSLTHSVVDDFSIFAIMKYINANGRLNTTTECQDKRGVSKGCPRPIVYVLLGRSPQLRRKVIYTKPRWKGQVGG